MRQFMLAISVHVFIPMLLVNTQFDVSFGVPKRLTILCVQNLRLCLLSSKISTISVFVFLREGEEKEERGKKK